MMMASQDTITYAVDYMNIYCLGTLFTQLTLGLNAVYNCTGENTDQYVQLWLFW